MRSLRKLVPLVFTVAFTGSEFALADESGPVPEPITAAWETPWNESIDELIAEIVDGFREELSDVEEGTRSRLLDDMEDLFRKSVAWDVLGETTVRQLLLDACGSALLVEVAPYFSGERPAAEIPEELNRRYYSCYIDVDLYVGVVPAYAISDVASKQLRNVFLKHGVDPDRR